jgi:hypothetical protein
MVLMPGGAGGWAITRNALSRMTVKSKPRPQPREGEREVKGKRDIKKSIALSSATWLQSSGDLGCGLMILWRTGGIYGFLMLDRRVGGACQMLHRGDGEGSVT